MKFGSRWKVLALVGLGGALAACGKKDVAAPSKETPKSTHDHPATASSAAESAAKAPAPASPDAAGAGSARPAAPATPTAATPDRAVAAGRARKASGSAAARNAMQRPGDLAAQMSSLRSKLGLPAKESWKNLRPLLQQRASSEPDAALLLGLVLGYEPEFAAERAASREWLEKAAAAGNARAMAELGRLWLADDSSAKAPAEAERWLNAAWAAGESEGAFLLAIGRRLGLLEQGGEDPIRLLIAASDQGNNRAALLLSLLNREEPLTELEPARILAGLERAAGAGNVLAMMELADLSSRAGDTAAAIQWYEKAAIAGAPEAPLRLVTLARKQGLDQPAQGREGVARAIDLLRAQVADPATAPAESFLNLAALIAPGARTPEREAEVKRLLNEAASRGSHRAQVILYELDRGMTLRDAIVPTMKLSSPDLHIRLMELKPAPVSTSPDAAEFVGPKPVKVVGLVYPAELKASGVGGKVVLGFVVDVNGSVRDIEVVSSPHPALTAAAIEAVQQWKYSPAQKNGKPMPMRMHLPVTVKVPGGG